MMTTEKLKSPIRWVPTLYFAMGLPFVVLNMVSAVMFKDLGISDSQIAFWTSLIMWPWTIKFLWSPVLELYKTRKFFVVLTQITSGVLFGLVAFAINLPSFFAIGIALMAVIAFSGATHDIVADGTYMSELDKEEQARWIGWQGAFYNIAKLAATGGLVWLAGWMMDKYSSPVMAWSVVFGVLGALMLFFGLYHWRVLPCSQNRSAALNGVIGAKGATAAEESLEKGNTSVAKREKVSFWSGLGEVFSDFFKKKHIWYYIAFIIIYRLGEGFVMKIVPLFLKADTAVGGLGLSNQQIGIWYGTFGAAAFVLGSLLAGYYIAARGLKRTLFTLCCIFNIPFLVYALLAWFQPSSMWFIGGGIALEYFGYGFGFVGLTLFMMQQVAPGRHQTAHYAIASGIMNLSVMLTGAASGFLSDALGYKVFFIAVMVATIPAFIMTKLIPFTYPDGKEN